MAVVSAAVGLALLGAAAPARAEEPYFIDEGDLAPPVEVAPARPAAGPTLDAFSYVLPQEKHYLRAALEVGTLLIIGNVDYLLNTTARGGTLRAGDARWDLRYDWAVFHDKLTGEDWKVDTNQFNTNYISHPFAGTLYYGAARTNRLSVVESLGYTVVGALGWEMFGELREEVSINDIIATSAAGFAIGEAMTQLSSFFFRSKKNLGNDLLGFVFSPLKVMNDAFDGAERARSDHFDSLGFTADEWHEFTLLAGAGATYQASGTYVDQRFGLNFAVNNLPDYDGEARRRDFFDDGNAADLGFTTVLSNGRLADSNFHASAVPAGIYLRNGARDEQGQVNGDSGVFGWSSSFEYSAHDNDRRTHRYLDVLALLRPVGLVVEYAHQGSPFDLSSRFVVAGDFAGVTALALDDYLQVHAGDETNLQTVLLQHHYYHSVGVTLSGSIKLARRFFDVGGSIDYDTLRGIEGFDERQATIVREVPLADRRLGMSAWVGARIPTTPVRLELAGVQRSRTGRVGDVQTTRRDSSVYATVGILF